MVRRWFERTWLTVLASTAVVLGQKKRALDLYQRKVTLDPGDANARATSAALLMETGDPASACAQLRQLVSLYPNDAEAWFNLGFVLEQSDQADASEPCFRRAIELQPALDRAWYGLGLALIRCGRLGEAQSALRKNTELQPLSPFGWYQLAITEFQLGNRGEAWRLQCHLRGFEPRVAATLKRDLDNLAAPSIDGAAVTLNTEADLAAVDPR